MPGLTSAYTQFKFSDYLLLVVLPFGDRMLNAILYIPVLISIVWYLLLYTPTMCYIPHKYKSTIRLHNLSPFILFSWKQNSLYSPTWRKQSNYQTEQQNQMTLFWKHKVTGRIMKIDCISIRVIYWSDKDTFFQWVMVPCFYNLTASAGPDLYLNLVITNFSFRVTTRDNKNTVNSRW